MRQRILALIAFGWGFLPSILMADPSQDLVVVASGVTSGINNKYLAVVNNRAAFLRVWARHSRAFAPAPQAPEVDFIKDRVLVAFAGRQPTGGYRLEVAGMKVIHAQRVVDLTLIKPGKGCMVTEAATQPFLIASLAKTKEPVVPRLTVKTKDCDSSGSLS